MDIGEPIPCRCPKCRSTDLMLFEEFTVYDVLAIRDGKMIDRNPGEFPSTTGRVLGECANQSCKHKWKFRHSPVQAAFNAKHTRGLGDD